MRCEKCNIDLPDSYKLCPLCGSEAADTEPVLKELSEAPYPEYEARLLTASHRIKSDYPQKYILRVVMSVCAALYIAFILISTTAVVLLPASVLIALTSAVYFAFALREKGRLLHSAVCLLSSTAFALLLAVVSLILGSGVFFAFVAFVFSTVLFLILFILRTPRVKAQLSATFHL